MGRSTHVIAALIIVVLNQPAWAQERAGPEPMPTTHESMLRRIEAGDVIAISDASKSGNRNYIPALSKIVRGGRYRGYTDDSASEQARLALARLGAPEQLQQFWCAAISELPNVYSLHPPIEMFDVIGGWYAVEALSYFLGPNSEVHWRRAGRKLKEPSDIGYEPPQVLALRTLPATVPNPPISTSRASGSYKIMGEEATIWRDWIRAHEDELRRLEPTGEGVDISAEACKDGQPRKRRR